MILIIIVALLGIQYALLNFFKVKRLGEGTKEMSEIALNIRIGADTFLLNEYKVLIKAVIAFTIISAVFISWQSAVTFLIGATVSGLAGLFGMKMATYANVRVANTARTTGDVGKTLKVALRGGSVMGLSVSSFALVGFILVFILFKPQVSGMASYTNWCGLSFVPFSMCLSSYALGCSMIAMFNRVGGGIFTKAADMGADLVGKNENGIPEDDPRNPAVIADCVGDNVGDTAGLGSDLLESYVGAIVSAIILAIHLFISYRAKSQPLSEQLFEKLLLYPLHFATLGLISCILSLIFVLRTKNSSLNPRKEFNKANWIAAGFTGILNLAYTLAVFNGEDFGQLPFKFGMLSPWISAVVGILAGICIGFVSERYTSFDFKPTKSIADASKEGAAMTITQGMSVGMKSTLLSVILIGFGVLIAYACAGIFGIAMAAVGMLSFVTMTVSVDTYGPISDNAGGIAEMAHLPDNVRSITDLLDALGNTTAAMGKGSAIGSAAFATVSLMISYLYTFTPISIEVTLDILNPLVLSGTMIGAAISYYFSGLLINAVSKSAGKMVDEVRSQFLRIPGIMEGKGKPDYKRCIAIATNGALAEMKLPALISIFVPILAGFIGGPQFVAGILMGSTLSAIMLAIFCGNSGGAWDNAKKFIESSGQKGSLMHKASVVGDTVGDPFKDTVGPSLDILIKIMSTVSIIFVMFFSKYNLVELITSIFK